MYSELWNDWLITFSHLFISFSSSDVQWDPISRNNWLHTPSDDFIAEVFWSFLKLKINTWRSIDNPWSHIQIIRIFWQTRLVCHSGESGHWIGDLPWADCTAILVSWLFGCGLISEAKCIKFCIQWYMAYMQLIYSSDFLGSCFYHLAIELNNWTKQLLLQQTNTLYEGWVLSHGNYFFPSYLNNDTTK